MRLPPYSGTRDVRWSWLEWVPPPRRRMKGAALVAVMSGRKQGHRVPSSREGKD
ncbi:unnamed protein product [Arabidopsis halleri]